jgi:S1-C subfamily serine protease
MKSPREIQAIANILGGVPILGIVPGSPADQSGLRYGDIVLSLNGVATKTFIEFLSAHDASGENFDLEVFRNGALVRIEMEIPLRRRQNSEASLTPAMYS